jgi:hypothetical protein
MPREDDRSLWMYTGLVLRMATCLGLHCGTTAESKIKPFQADMRARLWWQICLVDVRISEDYGAESSALRIRSDCPCPLNVNDTDWDPSSDAPPVPHEGFTEMTYSLLRFEACKIDFESQSYLNDNEVSNEKIDEKASVLTSVIHSKYLRFIEADSISPIEMTTLRSGSVYNVKLRLKMYFPCFRDSELDLPKHYELFLASVDLLEKYNMSFSEEVVNFAWMAQQYTQWHAVAFALSFAYKALTKPEYWERIHDPVSRAINAVRFLFDVQPTNSHRWQPLMRLYTRAAGLFETIQSAGIEVPLQSIVSTEELEDMELLFKSDFANFQWDNVLEGF